MTKPRPPASPPTNSRNMSRPLPVVSLARRRNHDVTLRPDAAALAGMADELGARGLRKVLLQGQLIPEGREDWRLEAQLGATLVQDCVVTGAPVTTRIDRPVLRRFLIDPAVPTGTETEAPEDDSIEPLGHAIDLMAVLREDLSLAMPDYPRSPDAVTAADDSEAPDGQSEPASDAGSQDQEGDPDARPNPFAALARLKLEPRD